MGKNYLGFLNDIYKVVSKQWMLLIILVLGVLATFFYVEYTKSSSVPLEDTMISGREVEEDVVVENDSSYEPSKPLGQNADYATVTGITTSTSGLAPNCATVSTLEPSELLPTDTNSEWAKLNPSGQGELSNVNLLKAGYHSQINTISTAPLRNANLQLRSDPPVAKANVGPFLNSTIEPEQGRPLLEIGA
jgi:hypothetical protein